VDKDEKEFNESLDSLIKDVAEKAATQAFVGGHNVCGEKIISILTKGIEDHGELMLSSTEFVGIVRTVFDGLKNSLTVETITSANRGEKSNVDVGFAEVPKSVMDIFASGGGDEKKH